MKLARTVRAKTLLWLAAGFTSAAVAQPQDVVLWHAHSIYKNAYHSRVTQAALDATPDWPGDQPSPPLLPGKAIALAREQLFKMHSEATNWNLRGINLLKVGRKGQWIYSVRFEVPHDSPNSIPTPFDIVVLMNGLVVQPVPQKGPTEDMSMFGFDKARVRQVLQFYKDLTGRELLIDDDVPQDAATITSARRTLTKAETVSFLERELREQAGVVLVPIGTKGARVTYDPKAKRASP